MTRTGKLRHSGSMIALAAMAFAGAAHAAGNHYGVTISTSPTSNMSFSGGVYTATGDNAVLNVGDLTSALSAGNVKVTTGNGSGGDEAGDLNINAGFTWAASSALTLDAYHAIVVNQAMVDAGTGAATLTTDDGGTGGQLAFMPGGSLSFLGTANSLTINAAAYTLVNSIPTLASAIAANPGGFFALAGNYDATNDGTYAGPAVPTTFTGTFEGLGNAVSNLSIICRASRCSASFFAVNNGTLRDIRLLNAQIEAKNRKNKASTGGLVASSGGMVFNVHVTGEIGGGLADVGGIVGANTGTIENSGADVTIKDFGPQNRGDHGYLGGVAGLSLGTIVQSWATGSIDGQHMIGGNIGGLVGIAGGTITDSYAEAKTVGGGAEQQNALVVGGLVGNSTAVISTSYSTGFVGSDCAESVYFGGFIGLNQDNPVDTDDYWDKNSSKTKIGVCQGPNTGVSSLSGTQLKSALPAGFDPTIWAESPSINNGLPYLLANPPQW